MASRGTYGQLLKEARERSGFDLTTMARRLHIRPDILRAIEESDFNRMPARGYSKNMIRAYARTVGLNQNQISEMYLDEVHMFETGSPRLGGMAGTRGTRGIELGGQGARRPNAHDAGRQPGRTGRAPSGDGRRRPPDPYAAAPRTGAGRGRGGMQEGRGRTASTPPIGFGSFLGGDRAREGRAAGRQAQYVGRSVADSSYANMYAGGGRGRSAGGGMALPRFPLLIGAVILAVLIIVGIVVVLNGNRQSAEELPDIPISGLTDTANPEGVVSTTLAEVAPTSATFTYTVEAGGKSWIDIYENGAAQTTFSGVVDGPKTETYTVTGTLTLMAANPSVVTCAVDGKDVELVPQSDSGYYACTVDFAQVLAQWKEEHPDSVDAKAAADPSSSAAQAANAGGSSSSSSSASASSSSSASAQTT